MLDNSVEKQSRKTKRKPNRKLLTSRPYSESGHEECEIPRVSNVILRYPGFKDVKNFTDTLRLRRLSIRCETHRSDGSVNFMGHRHDR